MPGNGSSPRSPICEKDAPKARDVAKVQECSRAKNGFTPMITTGHIDRAVQILVREASPQRIILFGSFSRGENRPDSDLDFLVIEAEPVNRHKEMVRLRRALSPMRIPVDIIVKSAHVVREWGNIPGTFLYDALREGRLVYEKP